MEERNEQQLPCWMHGKDIDEECFCQEFRKKYPMIYVEDCFYGDDGAIPEQRVRQWMFEYLSHYFRTKVVKKVNYLMDALKLEAGKESLSERAVLLHVANGTYDLKNAEMGGYKLFCRYRLPVNYNPEAPKPERWLKFLGELLYEEDIPTLQEFIGYCLMPVNYGQKMLLILGKGGEGKSRVGIVLRALLGDAMANGSLQKLESSQFARADLQNKLLMVDDDLQLAGLRTTGYIKTLVTAEHPLDLERKGKQSFQGKMFCRLMAFGNGNLRSLHDRSNGFFRRQIILTTKDRPADRVDDPFLAGALKKEVEGILLWAIEGLGRLIGNNMEFTISDRAKANLYNAVTEGNNILDFLCSEGYIRFDPYGEITSRNLYNIYRDWCDDNISIPLSPKSFSGWLIANAPDFQLTYSNHIPGGNGRLVRGFRGITATGKWV